MYGPAKIVLLKSVEDIIINETTIGEIIPCRESFTANSLIYYPFKYNRMVNDSVKYIALLIFHS